ncbi:hypothetical protein [uncultured Oxalicibacterium sp.]|uniref:hypothetical protein n=1 Tax=uncultured Oxalicibacterium sp. TaxID=1168540 RepID=UPI0025DAF835|nr:hypothetical protein [uncultured Oxalicibacterium sp.]
MVWTAAVLFVALILAILAARESTKTARKSENEVMPAEKPEGLSKKKKKQRNKEAK